MASEYLVVMKDLHTMANSMFAEILAAVLAKGVPLRFEASGSSMFPFIHDEDVITISNVSSRIRIGDVVAFANPDIERLVVHRVVCFKNDGFLIKGDNSQATDGWIPRDRILGYVTRIEHDGRRVQFGLGIERLVIAFLSRKGWLRSVFVPIRRIYRSIVTRLLA